MTDTIGPRFTAMEELWDRPPAGGEEGILAQDVLQIEVIHFTNRIRVEIHMLGETTIRTYFFERVDCSLYFSDEITALAAAVYAANRTQPYTDLRPYLAGYPGWVWHRAPQDGPSEDS